MKKRNFLAKQYCHGWIIQISRVVLYEQILKLSCIRKNILVKKLFIKLHLRMNWVLF